MKTPPTPVPDADKKAPNRLDRLKKAVRGTIIKWSLIILLIFACAAIGTAWVIGEINVSAAVKKAEAEKRIKTAADEADKPVNPQGADAQKGVPTEEDAGEKEEAPVDIAKLKESLRAELLEELKPAQPAPVEPAPAAPAVETDPNRIELATMEREELIELRANKDKIREELKAEADAELAKEKAEVRKVMEETNPGEIRVIHEPFDPKKHKEVGPVSTKRTDLRSRTELSFDAQKEPVKYKDENGNTTFGRFVLLPNGMKLENTGSIPKLKDSNLEPYPVKVNRGTAANNEIMGYWCVREKGE